MLSDKEREVKELIDKHLEKVSACLGCFRDCMEAILATDKQKAERIHNSCDYVETEADMIRRKIADSLYSGAFLPLARKDIYMLSEAIDEIANSAEKASDMIVFQYPQIPPEYTKGFLTIIEKTLTMFGSFREAMAKFLTDEAFYDHEHVSFVRDRISSVIEMESEIDKQEELLIRQIFSSDLPLAHKLQLELFLQRITCISDEIEDAADRLNVLLMGEKI